MKLLKKLLKNQPQSKPAQEAKPPLSEVEDTLSFLILKCSVIDGLLQSIQNVTGCERPEAARKAENLNWNEITYTTYCDLLEVMSFAELEYVGGLQYDPLLLKYRKEMPDIIMKRQHIFAGIIALCCTERSDIIQ